MFYCNNMACIRAFLMTISINMLIVCLVNFAHFMVLDEKFTLVCVICNLKNLVSTENLSRWCWKRTPYGLINDRVVHCCIELLW